MRIAWLIPLVLVAGCRKQAPPKGTGCCNVVVGYNAGTLMNGNEKYDTIIGAFGEISPGLSNTTEIGPGECKVEGATCINGVPLPEPSKEDVICIGDCGVEGTANTVTAVEESDKRIEPKK